MVVFKTFNDLVISWIEYLRLVQPELDTKPGTVSRDVFIDAPSQQLSDLYSQLQTISGLQSLFATSGSDLSKLGSNYGASRIGGGIATGVAVFTTNSMDVDILISRGSVITARNGVNFETTSDTLMAATSSNVYRATAARLRADLDLASIDDDFAIEVNVQALSAGTSGNVGRFSVISHNIFGLSNVTNLSSFSGGSNAESDDEFRARILSIFAGSNTGTALGYETAIGIVPGVLDSEIVVPGDPLLIRDGTEVATDTDGNLVVSDPGTGGKVDIYILGSDLESEVDSFIYIDSSGDNDPTNTANDVVLGQNGEDITSNIAQRRVELLAAGTLPNQPVDSIISVAGSSSGANFVEKFTDDNGTVRGNYELIKDTGDFGGSAFGFDKLRWVSNIIELGGENTTKGLFNGTDSLEFADAEGIQSITQDYLITNENSTKNLSDRSSVLLHHSPVRTVSRVVNITTGERYTVSNQNPDGDAGDLNTTGRITISGSTLPVGSDVLQVDYTWVKPFDRVFDFDNLDDYNPVRTAQDSVDWGFCNLVKNEPATVSEDAYGVLTVTVSHPITRVLSVNTVLTDVSSVNSGAVTVSNTATNVLDIKRVSDSFEVYNTDARGGSLSGATSIILPEDTIASEGDAVTVRYNVTDVFSIDGYAQTSGTFDSNTITLLEGAIADGTSVLVNYIANVSTLVPEVNISSLPVVKNENKFTIGGVTNGEQPTSNLIDDNDDFTNNLRRAGSNIVATISSLGSPGTLNISGSVVKKVENALVTVTSGTGYEVDLRAAILNDLGTALLPSDISVIKLVSFERVNVDSSNDVSSVDNVYDITNYKLKDNSYDLDIALEDSSLTSTSVLLPQTSDNVSALLSTSDIVRVSFYYIDSVYSEQLYFSGSGTHITNGVFLDISRIEIGSGFVNASGDIEGTVVIRNYNQPSSNTSYSVAYNYIAPKENERITVTFNYNSLINDISTTIDSVRPITADVLIKEAASKDVDIDIRIVLLSTHLDQEQTVRQDAIDAVTSFLSASSLGSTVDASDVSNALYSVSGIDRVRILTFSSGDSGNVSSIEALKNEYIDAGNVSVEVEER